MEAPAARNTTAVAVILAGGRGTRLEPYTSVLPKPLMPIGTRPILEIVLDQLESSGIRDVTLCVGYLAHLIRAVLDNSQNGREQRISYVHEPEPLGTAGPLRLIDPPGRDFIVMNGDVLTTLSYADLLDRHASAGNALTIATHRRLSRIDYGVLGVADDGRVMSYTEKPQLSHMVSMGVYVLDPSVLDHVPDREHFDFPDLVSALLDDGVPVGTYEYEGLWLDIGRREDYEEASRIWPADGEPVRADRAEVEKLGHVLRLKAVASGSSHSAG